MSADDRLWRQPAPSAGPLAGTVLTGVLAGGMFGGVANIINGSVSPDYFVIVMRWGRVENVWRSAVAQGVFEGLLWGLVLATIFAAVTGIITRAGCSFRFCVRHLLGILAAIGVCWLLGGIAGIGLASLSAEFFRTTFVPRGFEMSDAGLLPFAWVGGSIWGAQFGGVASLVVGLVVLRAHWHRIVAPHSVAGSPTGSPSDQ